MQISTSFATFTVATDRIRERVQDPTPAFEVPLGQDGETVQLCCRRMVRIQHRSSACPCRRGRESRQVWAMVDADPGEQRAVGGVENWFCNTSRQFRPLQQRFHENADHAIGRAGSLGLEPSRPPRPCEQTPVCICSSAGVSCILVGGATSSPPVGSMEQWLGGREDNGAVFINDPRAAHPVPPEN